MRRVIASLVLLVAVSTAGAAQAAASGPTSTLHVSTFRVLSGHSAVLTGRISSGVAGLRVGISSKKYGRPAIARIATVTTRSGGSWSLKIKPTIQTTYQAHFGSSASRALTIGVQPAVGVEELGNGNLSVHVRAARSFAGRLIQLQRKVGHGWRTVDQKALSAGSNGLFVPSFPSSTIRVAMSVNQAGAGYLGTMSHPLVYHAFGLTIAPTSFRVLYGKPVTLSGRLVNGAAGQKIGILAWRYGRSSPTKIGSVTTREGGVWSFHAKPRIQTTYEARWAGTKTSRRVAVGVEPVLSVGELANGQVFGHVDSGRSLNGHHLKLQRRTAAGAWKTIGQKQLGVDSSAVFSGGLSPSLMRIALSVNEAGVGYLGALSHPFTYRAPALTLALSSSQVLYGKAVKLSGRVLAGAIGQRVEVFARPYGGSAPHRVKIVTTRAGGSWSYLARPGIQTTYWVRAGSITSPHVIVGVKPAVSIRVRGDRHIVAHISAIRSFRGKKVELQRQLGNGSWTTIAQKPLNFSSTAVFETQLPSVTIRIAMSVNQAGAGFLGTASHSLAYHPV